MEKKGEGEHEQPAEKRRKTGEDEWLNVKQWRNDPEKRKSLENEGQERAPKKKKIEIRNYLKENETNENEREEEDREEKKKKGTEPQEETKSDVQYGEWMEAGF